MWLVSVKRARSLAAAIAAISIACLTQPASGWPPNIASAAGATFTSGATAQPASVAAGAATSIVATVSASSASIALVDVEVHDSSGAMAFHQWFDTQSFTAGQTRTYVMHWNVLTSATAGTYAVKICVFAPGWVSLYQWNDAAAQIVVTSGTPPTFTTSAGVSPAIEPTGGSATITASVTSARTTTALIDIEVYNPSGTRVYQALYDNQVFTVGQSRTYASTWQVAAASSVGTYVVDIGIFAPGWASIYAWNASASSIAVVSPTATPTPTASPTSTVAPTATVTPKPATATPTPSPTATPPPASSAKDLGVNISGAEFGESHLPGVLGTDYLYPADGWRMSYVNARSLKLVRIPFRWERLQPTAFGPLSAPDVAGLTATVNAAQAAGEQVILDMHNYGRYYNTPLTEADAAKFDDAWTKLATTFAGNPGVYGYELMNEPHDLAEGSAGWDFLAQSATTAIRAVDTHAYILAPGYEWQGAWTWQATNPTLNVIDPSNRLLYAAHQYFDPDGSGMYVNSYDADGAYPTIGVDRLQQFLGWLAARHVRGIVTEYGIPNNDARWQTVLDNFLATLNSNSNIQGGTYWSSGPWWGSYPLSVEPVNGRDAPQMAILQKYPSHP